MSFAIRRLPCQLSELVRTASTASSHTISRRPLRAVNTTRFPKTFAESVSIRSLHSTQSRADGPDEKVRKLSQRGLDEAEQEVRVKQNQVKRPWLRENADKPPAEQPPPSDHNAKGIHTYTYSQPAMATTQSNTLFPQANSLRPRPDS